MVRYFALFCVLGLVFGALSPLLVERDYRKALVFLLMIAPFALMYPIVGALLKRPAVALWKMESLVLGIMIAEVLVHIYIGSISNPERHAVLFHAILMFTMVLLPVKPLVSILLPILALGGLLFADSLFKNPALIAGDLTNGLFSAAMAITGSLLYSRKDVSGLIMHNQILSHTQQREEEMQDVLSSSFTELLNVRDVTTGVHVHNTVLYMDVYLEALKTDPVYGAMFTEPYCTNIRRSVALHDIGKLSVADDILCKAGKLTPEEFDQMKEHTTIGAKLFAKIQSSITDVPYLETARLMANYHHERWDGGGYPAGLHGEDIPLEARIMAVVDVYEALTGKRSYKERFSNERALEIIQSESGTHFELRLVDCFFTVNDQINEVRARLAMAQYA